MVGSGGILASCEGTPGWTTPNPQCWEYVLDLINLADSILPPLFHTAAIVFNSLDQGTHGVFLFWGLGLGLGCRQFLFAYCVNDSRGIKYRIVEYNTIQY